MLAVAASGPNKRVKELAEAGDVSVSGEVFGLNGDEDRCGSESSDAIFADSLAVHV
ncbi:hypothetical protein BN1232_06047 [Mycobacterium lentiflavum]|uniref:Uncharacterized protein n=1 Tax=Mycobacterium lentiflavum TaxID=141349 RepID=A0A0E4H2N0_MYCLN|nr:hypothetical protein BN1232_06047 [Mycobacterium lentiflavum]